MMIKIRLKKSFSICICTIMMMALFGCTNNVNETPATETATEITSQVEEVTEDMADVTEAATEQSEKATEKNTEEKADKTENKSEDSIVDLSDLPEYSDKAFIELNENVPAFTEEEKKSTEAFERYSELDKLGRCGVAFANICQELMPTEERGDIGDVRPSGWHTVKYSDIIEDNYLYNRSHLIAYSLAGENANEKNLITGTRYLNQDTMQIFELKVLDYVRANDNHVLYRVTPFFEGDNLVATGVQMEAWSVEDDGKGVCFNVFCYNVQPGIEIDYATGESKAVIELSGTDEAADSANSSTKEKPEDQSEESSSVKTTEDSNTGSTSFENTTRDYVVNTNSKKIHLPYCSSVDDMKEKNKWECTSTLNELKEKGYDPCGRCLAEYR